MLQSTLVIAARVITANLVNGKKIMGTNLHQLACYNGISC